MIVSDEMACKVADLLERNAVALVHGYEDRAAVVNGRHGWYVVKARTDGVECECQAHRAGSVCSHQLAAMVIWHDALNDPFSGIAA